VIVAGCGSSVTQRDFVTRADGICAAALREVRAVPPPSLRSGGSQAVPAVAGYLARVVPIVTQEAAALRRLQRPSGGSAGRALLDRYLAALAQEATDYRRLAAAARRGDAAGVADAEGALRASPAVALAARYGLRTCGEAGATIT
jgi:hypothetical protein